jgi:hypothetical protein
MFFGERLKMGLLPDRRPSALYKNKNQAGGSILPARFFYSPFLRPSFSCGSLLLLPLRSGEAGAIPSIF